MSRKDKLIERLLNRPADFEYNEAKSLLLKLGYREDNRGRTSGSRVAFIKDKTGFIIRIHKPHPGKIFKKYQVERLIEDLINQGEI